MARANGGIDMEPVSIALSFDSLKYYFYYPKRIPNSLTFSLIACINKVIVNNDIWDSVQQTSDLWGVMVFLDELLRLPMIVLIVSNGIQITN